MLPHGLPLARVSMAIFLMVASACGSSKPFINKDLPSWSKPDSANSSITQTIYLVGDAGEPELEDTDPVLEMLEWHLRTHGTSAQHLSPTPSIAPLVAFLGDNIYESGLPEEEDPDRQEMEQKIIRQMDAVKSNGARAVFVPGNHDWNHSRVGGLEAVIREEEFVKQYLDDEDSYLPGGGCGGPEVLELSDKLVVIGIDSEWYLTNHLRAEGNDYGCSTESDFDFFVRLEDKLDEYEDRHIVLLMHHPIFSNSNHGGHYSLADNIFPLRLINEKWMIPLPIIGSIYPLLRKYGVSRQDIPHPKYQELKNGLLSILEDYDNVVVASGHDHNLQLKEHEDNFFVVSGSASKLNFVARGRNADFTHQAKGFGKVNFYENGEVWLEFWAASKDNPRGEKSLELHLYTLESKESKKELASLPIDYSDSVKMKAAGEEYEASAFKKFWLGEHYRKEWTTPVKLSYLDIEKEAGGLVPLQKGGGKQTISLRLQADNEVQYTLRSINKNPEGAVPEPLHGTFAEDLVKDQISSAHPYGALVVPTLASAAKIYHTNPKVVYVPDDPRLGRFRPTFAGMMALLEIRPDEDLSQFKRFGFSENVVSTNTLLQKLREDNDNEVDQQHFLRSRLFDMIIGDWDRHQDQWRWAEFEKESKGAIYQAVPRDRDQVFTKFDGVIPWLASRKWAQRNLSHFDYDFDDIVGLNLSAEVLDRRLLNKLDWTAWEEQADSVKLLLTDQVIDRALTNLPDGVYEISGPEIAAKLKSRRDQLSIEVRKYYQTLAKHVDITGSEKHEYFRVERNPNGETEVSMFKTGKEGKIDHLIYHRTFHQNTTEEIRIYTLGGKDSVLITGEAQRAIKLRIVGGNDENTVIDRSNGGKVIVYSNTTDENLIVEGPNTKVKSSDKDHINEYEPDEFQYDFKGPLVSIEINPDDGLYLGGGVHWNNYGFRKKPYKSEHSLLGHLALATGAFNFEYSSTYYSLFGRNWDLSMQLNAYGPRFVFNYFNQGNGTVQEVDDIDFYRIRMNYLNAEPSINYRFNKAVKIGFGPSVKYFDVESDPDNITASDDFDSPEDLTEATFIGSNLFIDLSLVDYEGFPRRGLIWRNQWSYRSELSGSDDFHRLSSDLAFYVTPNVPIPITFALRFGVSANLGSYKFYQSNFLGGNENLRGYRRTRFAGKTSFYQNTEIRIALSKVHNYFFTGYWGILGFVDHGRVWTDGEGVDSNDWKRGYGPGLWLNFFRMYTMTFEYGIGKDDNFFTVNLGLQF